MKRTGTMVLALAVAALSLAACGGDALAPVRGPLKARDYAAARKALEPLLSERPGLEEGHYLLFVLDRFELMQTDPTQQDALSRGLVKEYDWIAAKEGLVKSYGDMETSLQSTEKSRDLYGQARQAVFGER